MNKRKIVQMILNQDLSQKDKEDIIDMLANNPIAIDVDKEEASKLTFGEKLADKFSVIAGSWGFIILFLAFLLSWIIINTILFKKNQIDPYPFILLNLILSCVAAVQAPIIMMSQNRASKKDSIRNQNDYKIDLKSELILEDLHKKVELVLKNQNKILSIMEKVLDEKKLP